MPEDVYERLVKWLVTTFRALPGIDSPEFREVVHFMYTPEEALLAVEIGPEGGTLDELAARTNRSEGALKVILEVMGKKGTLYREPDSDDPVYRPLGVELPGLIETSGWGKPDNPYNRKLLELWGKFKPIYINEGVAELDKHQMAWCMVSALPPDARPEENLFEQIKKADYIAVAHCACRKIDKHAVNGKSCDCVMESCMFFGELARWGVESGHSRHVTTEEALDILKACETRGQIHTGMIGLVLCNCCSHACINLCAQAYDKPHSYLQNHFYPTDDPETCTSCGICIERCPVGARQMEAVVLTDQTNCIGCGACVTGCGAGAIRMVRRPEEDCERLTRELATGFRNVMSRTRTDPAVYRALSGKRKRSLRNSEENSRAT